MFKPMKTLRALGRAAPLALSIAIMAPSAQAIEDETYWYASGDPSVPDGQLCQQLWGVLAERVPRRPHQPAALRRSGAGRGNGRD